VAASLGVAERLGDTAAPEQLVGLADQALATAKQSGRNRVVCYSSLHEPMPSLSDSKQSHRPLACVLARDVMSTAILCPNQNDTVRQVADFFLQLRVTSAPIVDDAGMLVGIVAEADLLTRTVLGEGWEDKIGDVMRTDVVRYEENTPVDRIYEFLSRVSVPRIVVVSEGRPSGVISRGTLLRWFRNWVSVRREAADHHSDWSDAERACRRAGIVNTATTTARRAAQLARRIEKEEDNDFVPCVVGEATRLQSLVNDLLGHCTAGL
jgi:CBS domain-containing protein